MELGQALQEPLTKEKEFWGASKTLNQLASGKYFVEEGQDEAVWPQLFTEITGSSSPITIIYSGEMYSFQIISTRKRSIYVIFEVHKLHPTIHTVGEEGSFNAEPKEEYSLAVSSLGGCIHYLQKCLIERPLLALKQFQLFAPQQFHVRSGGNTFPSENQKLVLDNISIANLEVKSEAVPLLFVGVARQ